MGDRFGRSYYQAAVDTYEYLVPRISHEQILPRLFVARRQAPAQSAGRHGPAASATYEAFVKRYPRSPRPARKRKKLLPKLHWYNAANTPHPLRRPQKNLSPAKTRLTPPRSLKQRQ